jgi:nitrogen fixation protein FixH
MHKELSVKASDFSLRTLPDFRLAGLRQLVIVACLLVPTVCPAAISFVQQNYSVPQAPQSIVSVTYAAAQVAGDTNIVAIGWSDSTSSVTSITDSRNNIYSLAIGPTRQSGVQSISIYVAKNVVAAAANQNTVTVTFSAAVPYPDVRILAYRGLDTVAPVEAAVGAAGTGATSNSGSLITTNANDLLFAANNVSSLTNASGGGFTNRVITSPDGDIAEDRIVTAAGTYSATASMLSGSWVMQLVALKAAGSQPVAATPTFNPAPGTYTAAQTVHLADTTPGATIYYTVNGSTPTTSSTVYNDATPIQVNGTTTIKAIAAAPGFANSAVASGDYAIQQAAAATPTFNPAPGTYTAAQTVHLADTTPGATIYYTVNGSTPTTSSTVYNDATPIQVNVATTIKAIAAAPGLANSSLATGTYTIQPPTAATPTFNPVPGTYTSAQTVHLAETTVGATIYYTVNGSTPTTSSAVYNDATPIQVSGTTTIKAIAAAAGFSNSAVAAGAYTIGAPPPIAYVQGNYAVPQSPQSTVSVTYTAAQVAGNTNIIAIGWSDSTSSITGVTDSKGNTYGPAMIPTRQNGIQSLAIYIASNIVAAPAGSNAVRVTFGSAVPYPDVRVLEYSGLAAASPLDAVVGASGTGTTSNTGSLTTVNANDLLFAANNVSSLTNASGGGFTNRVITSPDGDIAEDRIVTAAGTYSATASMLSGSWVMQLVALKAAGSQPVAATPTFNPAPGTYTAAQTVHLADTTPGATIYYTVNGSTPTTSSTVYNDATPIQVNGTTTIKAIAAAPGFANSAVASGDYAIQQAAAATPTFNPAPGTYTAAQTVHLADTTPGATIYYTVNGSTPTTSSTVYNDATPIQVNVATTIKAIAAAPGLANSSLATGTYTIQPPTAATPTFNPVPGTYTSAQTVHLAETTVGATIYYTVNGSTPTTSSAVYNDATPIQVSVTTTVKAIAAASGYANSTVATGAYSIGAPVVIKFVQVNSTVPQTPQSSASVTYTGAQTAGNLNIVAIGWTDSSSSVTSVTDTKGNTYTVAVGPTVQSGVQSQVIYIAKNIVGAAAGANTVRVNFSATVPYPDVRILEYGGLDPVSPLEGAAGASGSGALADSGPISTSYPYDLLFGADYVSSYTNAPGNGYVTRVVTSPDGDIAEDQIATATGTYTGTALVSNGNWIMQTIALRGAGLPPPPPDPSKYGQWSSVTSWPVLPIHVSLMPNGKVLAFGHDTSGGTTEAIVWDPSTGNFQNTPYNSADFFCSGHGLLPDGRVFIAGGHVSDHVGIKNAAVFDPTSSTWTELPAMSYGRWYPTVTSLPDGRMLVSSGEINCVGCDAKVPEIYNPSTNSWTQLTSASLDIPIYPHMFVLPDGRVLNTGSYELPVATRALDTNAQSWATVDPTLLDAGSAVMYLPGKILKTGTSATSDPPFKQSAATAYMLDMTQGSPAWRAINPMAFRRSYHNSTVLPDGNVLITGGVGSTNPDDLPSVEYAAEMWSPTTESFETMASMVTPRVYHSTALLLPDGRVLVGGGGQYQGSSPDQLNAEIYSPPYLFKGARPTVTSYPQVLQYGGQFIVQTPDAATISSVALVRLGSVTHAFNENQRYAPLAFSPSVGSLNVQAPANANIAPPGQYMLFLVNSSGVPSVGVFVQFPVP